MRIRVYPVLGLLCALAACGDDGNMDGPISGAGATGGTGVAGTAAGTGGMTAGTMMTGGTGMVTGGTGMASGGTGAAGTMATPMAVPGCEAADTTAAPAMLHAAAVEAVATMAAGCGGSTSCHQGNGKAGLVLLNAPDLNMLMVDKASCEVPTIPIVSSMSGQAGLDNSWLWIKITTPVDASGVLMSKPEWGMAGNCGQTPGTFGVRMPWGFNDKMMLKDSSLAAVRNWICAGAPAP